MKKTLRRTILSIALLWGSLFAGELLAQPGGGGGPGGGDDPDCWPPPCIPVDGGVGWLVAAGAIYGAKKAYNSRSSSPEEEDK